jgi:hypothetical protein
MWEEPRPPTDSQSQLGSHVTEPLGSGFSSPSQYHNYNLVRHLESELLNAKIPER